MPTRADLTIYQGDDFGTQIVLSSPAKHPLPFPPHPPYWPYWPYWPIPPHPLHPYFRLHEYGPCEEVPQDLTGWDARAQLRRKVADRAPAVAAEMGIQWTDPKHGRFVLFLDHTITLTLRGQYTWDLQMIKPDGFHVTVMAGCVNVTQDVTRLNGTPPAALAAVV